MSCTGVMVGTPKRGKPEASSSDLLRMLAAKAGMKITPVKQPECAKPYMRTSDRLQWHDEARMSPGEPRQLSFASGHAEQAPRHVAPLPAVQTSLPMALTGGSTCRAPLSMAVSASSFKPLLSLASQPLEGHHSSSSHVQCASSQLASGFSSQSLHDAPPESATSEAKQEGADGDTDSAIGLVDVDDPGQEPGSESLSAVEGMEQALALRAQQLATRRRENREQAAREAPPAKILRRPAAFGPVLRRPASKVAVRAAAGVRSPMMDIGSPDRKVPTVSYKVGSYFMCDVGVVKSWHIHHLGVLHCLDIKECDCTSGDGH